jgi:hypothetical protein
LSQEVAHLVGDELEVILEREVSGIEEVDLGVGEVAWKR